ncbi:hypothetical protein ACJJTC_013458 [Scirpophaga incertulas]
MDKFVKRTVSFSSETIDEETTKKKPKIVNRKYDESYNVTAADPEKKVQTLIVKHLKHLAEKMNSYFPKCDLQPMDWVRNPFSESIPFGHLPINEQEELIEMKMDRTLKLKFSETQLDHFWLSAHVSH